MVMDFLRLEIDERPDFARLPDGKVRMVRRSGSSHAVCTAKHGLVGLTKVVGLETAGTGITANAVCPG
jgi:NAD(P)-dependent dehydrogenase (short-subunit alcohol dehydrogenase family)